MSKPTAIDLIAEMDIDQWTLGDAETVVEMSGQGFDTVLEIMADAMDGSNGGYRRISPGLLVGLLFVEGRRRGDVTLDDVRGFNLTETLQQLAEVAIMQNVAAGVTD